MLYAALNNGRAQYFCAAIVYYTCHTILFFCMTSVLQSSYAKTGLFIVKLPVRQFCKKDFVIQNPLSCFTPKTGLFVLRCRFPVPIVRGACEIFSSNLLPRLLWSAALDFSRIGAGYIRRRYFFPNKKPRCESVNVSCSSITRFFLSCLWNSNRSRIRSFDAFIIIPHMVSVFPCKNPCRYCLQFYLRGLYRFGCSVIVQRACKTF